MPRTDSAVRPDRDTGDPGSLVLYVEGPRDRSILRAWAHRLVPEHARALLAEAVILGGRRPERALEHFRERAAGSFGLCVLDRDDEDRPAPEATGGLEFFTWGRRHIESYLLVPSAMRRALELSPSDHRLESTLASRLPSADDLPGWRSLDAKRLLGERGAVAQALGRSLPLARIARCTRESELHPDVHAVFARLREGLSRVGLPRPRRTGKAPRRRRA